MVALSSCGLFGTQQTAEPETTAAPEKVEFVYPAAAGGKIDLSKDDPSNDDIQFEYDEEGRIISCAYKSDGHEFLVGYNYRDGKVEVYAFSNVTVADYRLYEPSSEFDKSVGFFEQDGYFFKGFKSLKAIEVETQAPESTAADTSGAESGTDADSAAEAVSDTAAESDAVSDTAAVTDTETQG